MATEDTSTISALFKTVYEIGVKDYVNNGAPIFRRIEKMTDKSKFKNNSYTFAAQIDYPQSTASIAEGGTIPTPQDSTLINMVVPMKYHYGAIRLTAQLIELSKTDEGAFADAMTVQVNGLKKQFDHDLHTMCVYGDGTGEIGRATTYSGTTLNLNPITTNGYIGNMLLRRKMYLSSYSATSGGSQGADHKQVTAIATVGGSTATVESSANFQSNDYIFRSAGSGVDPRGKSFIGLGGLVDDGTRVGTIQNLSRTTYPDLKATLVASNSGTLRAWTPELMDQLGTTSAQLGGGSPPTAFYSQEAIQRRAASYIVNDRRLELKEMDLEGGYKSLSWNVPGAGRVPWFEDRFMRPHEIMAVRESDFGLAMMREPSFVNGDGRVERYTDRSDALEIWLSCWGNMFGSQFNNHSILRDVSHTL